MSARQPPGARTRLALCGACYALTGPVVPDARFRHPVLGPYAECRCEQRLPWEPHHAYASTDPQGGNIHWEWGGYPHARVFLCKCCAGVLINDHSRWAPFYCRDCRPRIADVNRRARRLVAPLGKHSIMNGVFIKANGRGADRTLLAALDEAAAGQELLGDWVVQRTHTQLTRLDLLPADTVALDDYLTRLADTDTRNPAEAFDRLLEFIAANGRR